MDHNFDTSWIDGEDVIEKEEMNHVNCYFVYINTENEVDDIHKEYYSLEVDDINDETNPKSTKISQNRLLGLIQKNKIANGLKYRLMDILQYQIPYDFTNISNSSYSNLLNVVTTVDEIKFEPSLCIFHEVNSVFFLFQEIPRYWNDTYQPAKPALKIMSDNDRIPKKKTKKVTFKDLDMRQTKKYKP